MGYKPLTVMLFLMQLRFEFFWVEFTLMGGASWLPIATGGALLRPFLSIGRRLFLHGGLLLRLGVAAKYNHIVIRMR